MTELNLTPGVDDPTRGRLRISPDGAVLAEELSGNAVSHGVTYGPGDFFLVVFGARIYYTTRERNPEIADWPKLGVVEHES